MIRAVLQNALTQAMREGDHASVKVLRSTLGALDNATAVVPADGGVAIEESALGAGASDVARKKLSASEITEILESEAREREDAAAIYSREGQGAHAESLVREAALIRSFINRPPDPAV